MLKNSKEDCHHLNLTEKGGHIIKSQSATKAAFGFFESPHNPCFLQPELAMTRKHTLNIFI